jgi:hypothetical protein
MRLPADGKQWQAVLPKTIRHGYRAAAERCNITHRGHGTRKSREVGVVAHGGESENRLGFPDYSSLKRQ